MDVQDYDDIIRHLVRIAAQQETLHADVRDSIRQQVGISQRLEITQAHVQTTLARIEAVLAHLLRVDDDGREA